MKFNPQLSDDERATIIASEARIDQRMAEIREASRSDPAHLLWLSMLAMQLQGNFKGLPDTLRGMTDPQLQVVGTLALGALNKFMADILLSSEAAT